MDSMMSWEIHGKGKYYGFKSGLKLSSVKSI
jgi:hypothetical protein